MWSLDYLYSFLVNILLHTQHFTLYYLDSTHLKFLLSSLSTNFFSSVQALHLCLAFIPIPMFLSSKHVWIPFHFSFPTPCSLKYSVVICGFFFKFYAFLGLCYDFSNPFHVLLVSPQSGSLPNSTNTPRILFWVKVVDDVQEFLRLVFLSLQ